MFIYLSKKIAIPHNTKLHCVNWNGEQGWIACGGANGLLKVLKLEGKKVRKSANGEDASTAPPPGAAASSNLSMNQTLEGHTGDVVCLTWNETYRKLTTSDQYGLIIVWMLHKGMWFEEMINNRNKSVVRDMKWTCDGQKICIVYEDGAVIVGSVDGNRMWGKELEMELSLVEWSPDGRNILFGTLLTNEVHYFDAMGNFIARLPLYALGDGSSSGSNMGEARLVGIAWYSGLAGYIEPGAPSLAIAFDNGRVQIMRDEADDNPVLIDTGMNASKIAWNTNGSVLAIAGVRPASEGGQQRDTQMVQFYSPFGRHLRTLKVPGSGISAVSWEGGSLRLALAVDSFIYFANIRPDYEWGYFSNTLVYAFTKPERAENCVCFWQTSSDERHIKYVKSLMSIRAAGENCVFATKTDDGSGQFILILCNAIGSPVDSKYIDIEPLFVTMTPYHVIVSNNELVYVWQYRTPATKLTSVGGTAGAGGTTGSGNATSPTAASTTPSSGAASMKRKEGRESVFHIDYPADRVTPPTAAQIAASSMAIMPGVVTTGVNKSPTNDPICAMCASKSTLVIARSSGVLLRFSLPHLSFEQRYVVRCRPQSISLNCNSTRLSIIDINGVLTLFDLDARADTSPAAAAAGGVGGKLLGGGANQPGQIGVHLDFERKDCWDLIWSDDNPELFACMEKARMYVFRGTLPEEPVTSTGYLCAFSELCITAVLMDEIMLEPEVPDKEFLLNFETKSLRDTRSLLATVPIQEAFQFVEENAHPRLWRILAETALEQLNFLVADKAFVACSDYQGIQFVKRLKLVGDRTKQRAEVCAYFRRFDEAEALYLELDARELAIELRTRLGDWFRVVALLQAGGASGDDAQLRDAYNHIGDYYADRQKWVKAYKFYAKAGHIPGQVQCAYLLDDYAALERLVASMPAGSATLRDVGDKFASVGLCSESVAAYLKGEDPKSAIDACVQLNQWDQAVELAEQHKFGQIEGLLTKYASHLLQKEKLFQAVELYRKANRHTEAAKLLVQLAQKASGASPITVQTSSTPTAATTNGTTAGAGTGDASSTSSSSSIFISSNPLRAKKLYVLAALEVDRYRARMLEQSGGAAQSTQAALQSLLTHDLTMASAASTAADTASSHAATLEEAWHGAEAYHFLLLAQRQLYSGHVEAAMKTSLRLVEYEDALPSRHIYSLLALAAFYSKYFQQCSRAFIKLEGLPVGQGREFISKEEADKYKQLALAIFSKHPPQDPLSRQLSCPKCSANLPDWVTSCSSCQRSFPACIATGRSLIAVTPSEIQTCRQCKHKGIEREMRKLQHCPLCHALLR